jgi:Holliday junction resolvase RusA-like endonuclease
MMWSAEIQITPKPKKRARHGNGNTYTDPEYEAYELELAKQIALWAKGRPEMTGPLGLVVWFRLPGNAKKAGQWHTARPDNDNLVKALKDAMTRAYEPSTRQAIYDRLIAEHEATGAKKPLSSAAMKKKIDTELKQGTQRKLWTDDSLVASLFAMKTIAVDPSAVGISFTVFTLDKSSPCDIFKQSLSLFLDSSK